MQVWHALWIERIDRKIAALQRRQAEEEPGRQIGPEHPDWIVELGIGADRTPVQVRAGDCYIAGKRRRAVSRDEARRHQRVVPRRRSIDEAHAVWAGCCIRRNPFLAECRFPMVPQRTCGLYRAVVLVGGTRATCANVCALNAARGAIGYRTTGWTPVTACAAAPSSVPSSGPCSGGVGFHARSSRTKESHSERA
ncbi:DUF6233 domain-containing protein [Streptomyces sp. WAC 05379]|uniref:DUF6233 domain-containing protein n=1 Tax=Streptomyces sp. WAC 05379 TaxID=2203207 RepID=UPI0021AE0D36|nr:DUF6233 domain-containing protein [Streptomyces sp. WAC 05379]